MDHLESGVPAHDCATSDVTQLRSSRWTPQRGRSDLVEMPNGTVFTPRTKHEGHGRTRLTASTPGTAEQAACQCSGHRGCSVLC